jgi:hypothetical protein
VNRARAAARRAAEKAKEARRQKAEKARREREREAAHAARRAQFAVDAKPKPAAAAKPAAAVKRSYPPGRDKKLWEKRRRQ